jgi:hypothetical protein
VVLAELGQLGKPEYSQDQRQPACAQRPGRELPEEQPGEDGQIDD